MAIPWLVVLQNIPWRDVIVKAPKVADEAKKLWTTIKKDPADLQEVEPLTPEEQSAINAGESEVHLLQEKTARLENAVDDLHAQLVESSAIIKALADQNEILVKHIEINRSRVKLLSILFAIFVVGVIFAFLKMQSVV